MCFYDQYIYACTDFKWGNFRQHCAKEYRMGETCGMKFVNETIHLKEKCKQCEKLAIKKRKVKDLMEKVKRWEKEGNRRASIEKARDDIEQLEDEIDKIVQDRERRLVNGIGSGRQARAG